MGMINPLDREAVERSTAGRPDLEAGRTALQKIRDRVEQCARKRLGHTVQTLKGSPAALPAQRVLRQK
jgi:hypothetical protein